jgi:hypothetical protein
MSLKSKWLQRFKDWISKTFGVPARTPPKTTPPTPTPSGTPSLELVDSLPWETIHWHGQNQAKDAVKSKILRSATISGDMHVSLDYDTNSDWPACKVIPGCQASFMVFTTAIDGALRGGHCDHLKTDCKTRDLGNLYNGYLLSGVPRGQDLYIALASHDGKQRTNLVKAIRR